MLEEKATETSEHQILLSSSSTLQFEEIPSRHSGYIISMRMGWTDGWKTPKKSKFSVHRLLI